MKLLLPCTILCLLALGCWKEGSFFNPGPLPGSATWHYRNNELPPATTTGENTMGCKINGEVWLSVQPGFGEDNWYWETHRQLTDYGFLLKGYWRGTTLNSQTSLFESSMLTISMPSFELGRNEDFSIRYFNTSPFCSEETQSHENGEDYVVLSRIDLEEKIISGKFNFTIIPPNCTDTIFITEGRFDIKGY